jgi:hypothetical protein
LLARPHPPRVETLNDADCMVANFWRATATCPDEVAEWADWPVNEADLHARHRWLVLSHYAAEFRRRMRTEPGYFDARVAGWWAWGACAWIGSGWCKSPESAEWDQLPVLTNNGPGQGVHAKGDGLSQQVPDLGSNRGSRFARGVHGSHEGNRPQLADAYARGRGVHGNDAADHYLSQQVPHLGQGSGEGPGNGAGRGVNGNASLGTCASRRAWLLDWFGRLRDRLRTTRVCCGHWLRVCDSRSVTTRLGLTGLFLDPPYPSHRADGTESRSDSLYATDGSKDALDALRDEVLAYCLERGSNPKMRIVVAGYDTDGYAELERHGWTVEKWSAQGGYGNRSKKGKANAKRECLWCSPHCLRGPASLFDRLDAESGLFAGRKE